MQPEVLAEIVANVITESLQPLRVQLAALEARVEGLAQRPALKYSGPYRSGETYSACSLATHQGGLWLAKEDTAAVPGGSASWQLIVKSGRAV